jgi:hypothetical protein
MLIVIPVSKHDEDLIEDFCDVLNFFAPYEKHSLLVVSRPSDRALALNVFETLRSAFSQAFLHTFSDDGPEGWPQGPNFYWNQTIEYLKAINNTTHWFWMELDVTPVEEKWIDLFEEEYIEMGKPCLGVIQEITGMSAHLAGTAVYPANLTSLCNSWESVVVNNLAFDVWCKGELVPLSANSNLIQHNFRTYDYRCTNLGMLGLDREFRYSGDMFAVPVRPGVVLVHGCNDGSLARLILNKPKKI